MIELTPPHDILTKKIGEYLPENEVFCDMMKKSYEILSAHPLNQKRKEQGAQSGEFCMVLGSRHKAESDVFCKKRQERKVL
mgnify:CR=1 FL=1